SGGGALLAIGQLSTSGPNLSEFVLANDNCSNKSVAAGASCTVDVSFSPTHAGSRTATLVVPSNAASSPDSIPLSGNGTTLADVRLAMTGPASASKGKQFSYLITVSNAGPSAAHNVVLTDPLPSSATLVGVSASQGSCTKSGGTIRCSLGDLAAGGSAGSAVSVKLTAKVGSTITN